MSPKELLYIEDALGHEKQMKDHLAQQKEIERLKEEQSEVMAQSVVNSYFGENPNYPDTQGEDNEPNK